MKNIFIVFLFISVPLFAQQQVLKLEEVTYSNFIKDRTAFSLSNSETGDLMLVIPDKKTVDAYLFNKNFEQTNKLTAESLRIKFKEIIGYRVTNKHFTTLFSTENRQYFGLVDFNFETGETTTEELDVNLKGEEILEAVTHNNRFFLLSIDRKYDGLIVRELLENRTFDRKEIPISGLVSFKDLLTQRNKPDAIGERKGSVFNEPLPPEIVEIDNTNPNSLETTSRLNKLYSRGDNLILTFDNFQDFTLVYYLNLNDFTFKEKRFQIEDTADEPLEKSNSFLYQDYFFQLGVNNDKMIFTVTDFNTGEKLKTYRATKDRAINFKNSLLMQKNGMFMGNEEVRRLDDTSQYLRKITNGQPGIAIQKINGIYQATLGGTQPMASGGGGSMMIVGGGVVGGAIGAMAVSIYFNPTYSSYGSYTNTKSIYFDSLFDTEFNHVNGIPTENVFDTVKTFQDSLEKIDAEEVFSHNDKVYFGYYDKKLEVYNIFEFDTEI